MKGEELTNRVLLFALGKTTALPHEFSPKIGRPF